MYCAKNELAFWFTYEGRCRHDRDHPEDMVELEALSPVIMA